MALTKFIPQIWNASMLLKFNQTAIAANIVNRQYEGDATRGNTVKITTAVDVEVRNYITTPDPDPNKRVRSTVANPVRDTGQDLLIDHEMVFDFYVDDIDRAQAAGSMEAYTTSAGRALAADADRFILATASAGDTKPDTGELTNGDQAFDAVRDLGKKLNKNLAPKGDRVLIVNAEFEALLVGASSKLTNVNTSGTPAGLRDAMIGRLLGFTVVSTENLPVQDTPFALGMWSPAMAYVSQIERTEGMRAQDKFADRLRGLHVYGGRVIRPEGIAVFGTMPKPKTEGE